MYDYVSGDSDAAQWDAYEATCIQTEKQMDELDRAAKLLNAAAIELGEHGRSRRFISLMSRSRALTDWHLERAAFFKGGIYSRKG